jgi:hypothetical protein
MEELNRQEGKKMQKLVTTVLAGVFLSTSLITGAAPALAQAYEDSPYQIFLARDRGDDNWRWRHRDRDRGWHRGDRDRDRWHSGDRDRDWRWRDHDDDDDDAVAAGIIGFAAGAIAGGVAASAARPSSDYYAYCAEKYRSFDPASGTYLGYDGLRHPCRM